MTNNTECGHTARVALTIIWSSFLAASVATMIFFAFVDPAPIIALLGPPDTLPGRTTLYSLGFFFFWLVSALASSLTALLVGGKLTRPT